MLQEYPLSLIAVTCGNKGAFIRTQKVKADVKAIPAKTVDTTGAGDAFWAAFLSRYLKSGLQCSEITTADAAGFASFAAAAASLCVEARGAIPAMPYLKDVERRLGKRSRL
ncbi:MAG: PfkB family carbohydrate kinase [Bacillota bacterium]|nr:PfkB family carbohydrate kinase [Bacillota bacterium]